MSFREMMRYCRDIWMGLIAGVIVTIFVHNAYERKCLVNMTNAIGDGFSMPTTQDEYLNWTVSCVCGAKLKVNQPASRDGYAYKCAKCGRWYAWAWTEPLESARNLSEAQDRWPNAQGYISDNFGRTLPLGD